MPITRSTWIDDDGSGTTGTIINNAELQKIYTNIDALVGPWIRLPFSAGRYTAPGGTWTVTALNESDCSYCVIGPMLFFNVYIAGSNLSGSPSALSVAMPAGFQCSRIMTAPIVWGPAGSNMTGFADLNVGSTLVSLRSLGPAIVGGPNTGYVYFCLAIPI